MAIAYLGLGSNMGNSRVRIETAIDSLSHYGTVLKVSSFYTTEPVGGVPQKWFLNCALKLETSLSPQDLLNSTLAIENELGRVRTVQNGPRTMDIDILLYDDLSISEKNLVIPHPRFPERRFVLIPLAEIAPEVLHPTLKKTIRELLDTRAKGAGQVNLS